MKKFAIVAVSVLVILSASACKRQSVEPKTSAQASPAANAEPELAGVSLENKRIIKSILKDVVPKAQAELLKATGANITFDIDWNNIATVERAINKVKNTIEETTKGLIKIAADPDGKQAIGTKIKTVRIKLRKLTLWDEAIQLSSGVLDIPIKEDGQWSGGPCEVNVVDCVTKLL